MERPDGWVFIVASRGARRALARADRLNGSVGHASVGSGIAAAPGEEAGGGLAEGGLLDGLTPRERLAVLLRFHEDLKLADVAQAMGCRVGTVKATLHSALNKLPRPAGRVGRRRRRADRGGAMTELGDRVEQALPPVDVDVASARARVEGRARSLRRTRLAVRVGAVALVLVVVGGASAVVVRRIRHRDVHTVGPVPTAGRPTASTLAAVAIDGRLVTVSAATGRVTRTLLSGAVGRRLLSWPTVSADGRTVYVALRSRCGDPTVVAVPLTGGATVEVAPGEDPAVSPDGRYLAMVRSAPDHSVKPCFAYPADSVVVRDLVTGSEVTWGATQLSGLVPSGLHWQADSRRLVFRTTSKGDAAPVHWFVDVGAAFSAQSVGITPEPPLPVVTPNSTWTILDGPGPRLLAAEGPLPISGIPVPVVALDPQTGRTRFEFSIASGWPDQGVAVLGVAGDDSGRRVALVVHSGELYLWNQGEPGYHADGTTGFRRLTNGIDSVAWVPSRPASLASLTGTDFSACTAAPPELRALSFRAVATPARRGRATTTVGTLRITNPGPTTVRLRLAAGATGEEIDPRTGQLRAGAPSVAIDWVTKAHVLAPGHSVGVTVQAAAAPGPRESPAPGLARGPRRERAAGPERLQGRDHRPGRHPLTLS